MELPAGYQVRSPRLDDAQTIYDLVAAYNLEVLGNANITLAGVNEILSASSFQPEQDGWLLVDGSGRSQMTLVVADGRPAAASDCNHAFVDTDNRGYVGRLAVIPEARGLGLAKYLLRQAFATDAAAGLDGTILHVDTNNPTPALGLYESVGMRPVQIADVWELKV